MRKKKQMPIRKQGPWLITSYSTVHNKGEGEDEFDDGHIEFEHKETGLNFLKEMSWIKSEGPFRGNKAPTLIDIWKFFLKHTPGTSVFVYKNWVVTRSESSHCFIYQLSDRVKNEYIHKNIISDTVCLKQDFASFINMLDNIQKENEIVEEQSKIVDFGDFLDKKKA